MDNTGAPEKVTVNKPWLYRTQAAWMTQRSPCNNVTDIIFWAHRRICQKWHNSKTEKVWTSKVSEDGLTSKECQTDLSSPCFCAIKINLLLMHISSCTSTTCFTLHFSYMRWKACFVGGKRTSSSICICPSDQWIRISASWPVSFTQQKANENGNWEENLLSDSDKNKEPTMHN